MDPYGIPVGDGSDLPWVLGILTIGALVGMLIVYLRPGIEDLKSELRDLKNRDAPKDKDGA